ncbi:MAG: D-alanyl-D-alanine carboxypeptidase/D-alanyl-D-alanine-endopeptidase [Parabacteroides sp.]|nr:D-alanyl-D-alanine carboxypeptidase/D-alanyl-D-alanine-endopeptidase [Parabacteroides sp.]
MIRKISFFLLLSGLCLSVGAQIPQPIRQFLRKPYMEGASFALIVKDVDSGETVFAYDTSRQLTPASVMKTVTTATALEILGEDYRFPTTLEYDGSIEKGLLKGNLYIKGSGDPSLGSAHLATDHKRFLQEWISALRKAGIHKIQGAVIADESVFDTEGTSLKWVGEDMGSYYGAGSYGLCVFDNLYKLALQTGAPGTRPKLKGTDPELPGIRFHNYLTAQRVSSDSSFIVGAPFATDRYLYGIVPANREWYPLKGDIPDPALFLAEYLTRQLEHAGITVGESPSCFRISREEGRWKAGKRTRIVTTYSPTLREIVAVTNRVSHNLFADALLKTIGLRYTPHEGEVLSSFSRGIRVLREYWREKGIDLSGVWMYDGSGLAAANKLSTAFVADLLVYMRTCSQHSTAFYESLPVAGVEGSVRNFLKGSPLQGKARLKSGSMSRVKGYAGYVSEGDKRYAIALFVNNYACDGRPMNAAIEQLLLQLLH